MEEEFKRVTVYLYKKMKEKCSWFKEIAYDANHIYIKGGDVITSIHKSHLKNKHIYASINKPIIYFFNNEETLSKLKNVTLIKDELMDINMLAERIFDENEYNVHTR